ncbi:MAG: DnaD domain protein [Dehalococcoidia bacterium]|nr:DnaD domain protein [Dehalococcoidia bacterium]
MTRLQGAERALFPPNAEVTPVPSMFFSHVLPEVEEAAELRIVLHVFYALRRKRVFPRFVARSELLADEVLLRGLRAGAGYAAELDQGLALALGHGLLVAVEKGAGEARDLLYFINDEDGRRTANRILAGELATPIAAVREPAATESEPLVALYEQNIGPVTPLIAEGLAEAELKYPPAWLPRAMKLAVTANVRRWSYVQAILERWHNEGMDVDEETGRDPERERLWERYVRGRDSGG